MPVFVVLEAEKELLSCVSIELAYHIATPKLSLRSV